MQGRSQRPLERATSLQRLGCWQLRLAAVGQEGTVDGRAKIDDNRAIRQCATYLCIDPRRSLSSGHFEAFDMTVDNACRVCSLEFDHMVNLPMFSAIMFPAQTA